MTPAGRYPLRILALERKSPKAGSGAWGVLRVEHPDGAAHPDLVGAGLARLTPGTIVEVAPGRPGSFQGRPQMRLDQGSWVVVSEGAAPEVIATRGRLSGVRDHNADFATGIITFSDPTPGPDGKLLRAGAYRPFTADHALGLSSTGDCRIVGRWAHHERYGWQVVLTFLGPDGTAISRLLVGAAAGKRIGWGKAAVGKLVDRYGPDTLDVLLGGQADRIAAELGVPVAKVTALVDAACHAHLDVELALTQAGFGRVARRRILDLFRPETAEERAERGRWAEPRLLLTRQALAEDPYALRGQVSRLQFDKVDRLAVILGVPADSPKRLQAWTVHLLRKQCDDNGDTLVDSFGVLRKVVEQLSLAAVPGVEAFLSNAVVQVDGDSKLALRALRDAERLIADRLRSRPFDVDHAAIRSRLHQADPVLTDEQLDAAVTVATHQHALLVGLAGTGKTRVLAAVASLYRPEEVLVGATTSMAAANIRRRLDPGIVSGTLHNLLRMRPGAECPPYLTPDLAESLRRCRLFVVEESSMGDTELAAGVLARLPGDCQIILAGDDLQLPAVGAGDVLRDLSNSGVIPVARLTTQHRASAEHLPQYLAWLRNGAPGNPSFPTLRDWEDGISFVGTPSSPEALRDRAVALVTGELPDLVGVAADDILVLTPTRKAGRPAGVHGLTPLLRAALNPGGQRIAGTNLHLGDPVISLVNCPDRGVHNGAAGRLAEASGDEILISFEGGIGAVAYPVEDAGELAAAYASTVHKAQGGEADVVVVLVDEAGPMLDRRWLYTAMSRARRLCVVVGPVDRFLRGARWLRERDTGLAAMLAEKAGGV